MNFKEEIGKLNRIIDEFDRKFGHIDIETLDESTKKEFRKGKTQINKLRKQKKSMEETLEMMKGFGVEDINMD